MSDPVVPGGILHVLRTGIAWRDLAEGGNFLDSFASEQAAEALG
jgi:hypothetical protein